MCCAVLCCAALLGSPRQQAGLSFQLSEESFMFCFPVQVSAGDTQDSVPHITLLPSPDSPPWFIIHPRAELHTFLLTLRTASSPCFLTKGILPIYEMTQGFIEKKLARVIKNMAKCQGNKGAQPALGLAPPGSQLELPSCSQSLSGRVTAPPPAQEPL